MPKPKQKAEDIPLIPFVVFKQEVKRVLSNSKTESDRQISGIHAENMKRRAAKKKG